MYGAGCTSRGVWCTNGISRPHNNPFQTDTTGPYPPVPITIWPVLTLQICDWWKRAHPLRFKFHFWAVLAIFGHPLCASLGYCVKMTPLNLVPDHQGSTYLCLLHKFTHQHWCHYKAIYLATNNIMVHLPACCLQLLLGRFLLLSLREISPQV